jgi:hypothetical protein
VGYSGCHLAATAILDLEGLSDPFLLGRVIRVPGLDKFTLIDEKVGDSSYAGVLEGRDLYVIRESRLGRPKPLGWRLIFSRASHSGVPICFCRWEINKNRTTQFEAWSRNACTASGVSGISATPLGVLESGIQMTALWRSM